MSYGRYFDELRTGDEFTHRPGRTINEFDDTLLSLLSMNQHPVHLDEHFARKTQHGRRLVAGPTVIAIVIGMTLEGGPWQRSAMPTSVTRTPYFTATRYTPPRLSVRPDRCSTDSPG